MSFRTKLRSFDRCPIHNSYYCCGRVRREERQSVSCKECGIPFTPSDRAYRKRQAKFCSPQCWYAFQRRRSVRVCGHCKSTFRSVALRKFCSRRCLLGSRGNVRSCRGCGNEFQSSHLTFCSWKCYSASRPTNDARPCKQCGREFVKRDRATTLRSKFCSMRCQKDHWLSLPHKGRGNSRGNDWPAVKSVIGNRDGMMCLACDTEQGARKPDVDHIIPYHFILQLNKRTGSAHNPNDPANLISLCKSCHTTKTSVERYLWEGDVNQFYSWVQLAIGPERVLQAMNLYGINFNLAKGSQRNYQPST